MTYLVGATIHGSTAILADNRVTWYSGEATDTGVKVGVLYPGLAYGIAGSPQRAYRLLRQIKALVPPGQALTERWNAIASIVALHEAERGKSFDLLLASRHSGTSELYRVRADGDGTARLSPAGEFITLGSGTESLDGFAALHYRRIVDQISRGELDTSRYPYEFSLALTAQLWGPLHSTHNSAGVGGTFAFVQQDARNEQPQEKSVLMFAVAGDEPGDAKIDGVMLGFADGALLLRSKEHNDLLVDCFYPSRVDEGDVFRAADKTLEAFVGGPLAFVGVCLVRNNAMVYLGQYAPIQDPWFEIKETLTPEKWGFRCETTELGARALGAAFDSASRAERWSADQTAVGTIQEAERKRDQKAYKDALRLCTDVIENPKTSRVYVARALIVRGSAHEASENHVAAIADYDQVVEMGDGAEERDRAWATFNRGVVRRAMGDIAGALRDYSLAIETFPPSEPVARALNNRGALFFDVEPQEALRDWSRLVDDFADVSREQLARALVNRAALHGREGRLRLCVTDATRAIDGFAEFVQLLALGLNTRANAYFEEGDSEKAMADCNRIASLDGVHNDTIGIALGLRACLRYASNDVEGFLDDALAATELSPCSVNAFNLALALLANNRDSDSKKQYKEAANTFPDGKVHAIADLRAATRTWLSSARADIVLSQLLSG